MQADEYVDERHRHRYEVNPNLVSDLEDRGLRFVGKDESGQRMEIVELKGHPYFVAGQFHPEFKSRPGKPSPLFLGLILASSGQPCQIPRLPHMLYTVTGSYNSIARRRRMTSSAPYRSLGWVPLWISRQIEAPASRITAGKRALSNIFDVDIPPLETAKEDRQPVGACLHSNIPSLSGSAAKGTCSKPMCRLDV